MSEPNDAAATEVTPRKDGLGDPMETDLAENAQLQLQNTNETSSDNATTLSTDDFKFLARLVFRKTDSSHWKEIQVFFAK